MTPKKVGIITFHAAHNYGSVLQAFALKTVVGKVLNLDSHIINFRTEKQKDQYRPLTKRRGIKYIIKNGYFLLNYRKRNEKYLKFEQFICDKLVKNEPEYNRLDELYKIEQQYDYYISGSDQIWNPIPNDFDEAYLLPFVKNGKRVAYAPSFGGKTWNDSDRLREFLQKYDSLSVREFEGQQYLSEVLGQQVAVMPDPTLLLDREDYEPLAGNRIIQGEYIFFYTLFASKEMIKIVSKISERLGLPVVISNTSNQYEIFNRFIKIKDCGPADFLSLIKHSKLNVVTSFHGTVFSTIFNKPFFAIDGMNDCRICTLLKQLGLENRSITTENLDDCLDYSFELDYEQPNKKRKQLRMMGFDYLKKALDINENDLQN